MNRQQALNKNYKLRNPPCHKNLYEPEKIEEMFEEYYRRLHTQSASAGSKLEELEEYKWSQYLQVRDYLLTKRLKLIWLTKILKFFCMPTTGKNAE